MARVNKKAIYAALETSASPATLSQDNAIPVNEVTNTPLVANEVERPELTGFFGAPGRAIASKTHAITIESPVLGGGLGTSTLAKVPNQSPLNPLIVGCFHQQTTVGADLVTSASGAAVRGIKYKPLDGAGTATTILYQLDDVIQTMVKGRGTLNLSFEIGGFSTMTCEYQSPFDKPKAGVAPSGGSRPSFQPSQLVTGQAGGLSVPGLPSIFANCVRSFSFTQGSVISAKDCATRAGNNPIEYLQTDRNATGEIVVDIDKAVLSDFYDRAGTEIAVSAPISVSGGKPSGLLVFGDKAGNQFVFGARNILIGAPTEGDTDGIATYTIPLTFKPLTEGDDYEFMFVGDLT